MQPQITKNLYLIGAVLTISGAICQFFNLIFSPYIFSLGALVLIYFPVKQMLDVRNLGATERRKARNGVFSGLLLGLAAYFMFTHSNSWVVAVLIYALSTLILSFRNNN
jgi:hypothetical protein